MDLQLRGCKALVTAATSGIGLAIAEGLAREGASVSITGRSETTVASAIDYLSTRVNDVQSEGFVCNCATASGTQELYKALPSVDILVNNLGVYSRKGFFDTEDKDWEETFSVNVLSGVRLVRCYAPKMVATGWGRILFVSSDAALNVPVNMIPYAASKAAILAIARGIAIEVAGSGVTVNSIVPGPTSTEHANASRHLRAVSEGKSELHVESEVFTGHRATSLTKRLASPEEIANMVVFLCSRLSSMTTGTTIRVDGGVVNQVF